LLRLSKGGDVEKYPANKVITPKKTDMEIHEMWCVVCKKFVRPSTQIADIRYGGWYCGHHTQKELKTAQNKEVM
jgi:hypothetical protein